MNLRTYFQRLREVEASISEASTVVVSLATVDGGAAGVMNEVSRSNAADLIVSGKARLADAQEAAKYRRDAREAWQAAQERDAAGGLRLITAEQMQVLQNTLKRK